MTLFIGKLEVLSILVEPSTTWLLIGKTSIFFRTTQNKHRCLNINLIFIGQLMRHLIGTFILKIINKSLTTKGTVK